MGHHVIEFDQECKNCNGTGLYVGMAERDGAAVVCHACKGTGCKHVVVGYDDFDGRKPPPDGVRRVYQCNPGICIGENETLRLEDFGGLTVAQWSYGITFQPGSEDREHTCPAWFYQCANYKKKPSWDDCSRAPGGRFSNCPSFSCRDECWTRWDKENRGI